MAVFPYGVIVLIIVIVCTASAPILEQLRELRADVDKIQNSLKHQRRRSCPQGYIRFKRSCMKFVMSEKLKAHWVAAEQHCQSEGGHLVSMDNKRKFKFIKKYLSRNFGTSFKGSSALLYTGLIYTDSSAKLPFDPTGPFHETALTSCQFRWTATGLQPGENATFRPKGLPSTNTSPSSYLSCVMLEYDPGSSAGKFLWLGYTCSQEKHSFICEVQLPNVP